MNKVFEKIIEKLEKEKMSYFLTIANTGDEKLDYSYEQVGNALDKAIKIVKQEAENYNNGWIPCSERLPDDFMSFEYLTIRKGHTLATITYYCVVNHKWYLSRNSSKEIDVIAWMELPSAYRPKEK